MENNNKNITDHEKEQRILLEYVENHMGEFDQGLHQIPDHRVRDLINLQDEMADFRRLMMYYECALLEVRTKLDVLNNQLTVVNNRNPIESIKSRIKTPVSIFEKMERRGLDFNVQSIEENLDDIAGIRVICSFIDDIYRLRDCLLQQDDVTLIQQKDYIAEPKTNGYRSLHLILGIPIFLTDEKRMMHVEVQFRTIAMDFWASVEHKMKYKKEIPNSDSVVEELRYSAELINQLDRRMIQIRDRIDESK